MRQLRLFEAVAAFHRTEGNTGGLLQLGVVPTAHYFAPALPMAFAQHPHCIVAAADHPLVNKRRIHGDALKDGPFIFREPHSATRQFFEHLVQAQSLQVKVSMELSGNETIKQAVMAGMGISFLSAHTFQIELEAGRLAVLHLQDMPKMLDWCFLHRRDSLLAGVNGAFKDFVLEHGARFARCRM